MSNLKRTKLPYKHLPLVKLASIVDSIHDFPYYSEIYDKWAVKKSPQKIYIFPYPTLNADNLDDLKSWFLNTETCLTRLNVKKNFLLKIHEEV